MVKNVFKLLLLSLIMVAVSSCGDDPLVASINASKQIVKTGETYTLSVKTVGGDGSAASYYWYENDVYSGSAGASSESFTQANAGTYVHKVQVQAGSEEVFANITVEVEQGTAPTITISNNKTTVRVNESYTLTANGGASNSTYRWNDGSTSKSATFNAPSSAQTVNHSVVVTTPGAPQSTATISVTVKALDAFTYPVHRNIKGSLFWVGEGASNANHGITNVHSSWRGDWGDLYGVEDWPGMSRDADGFPLDDRYRNIENPFYFALPYNDMNSLISDEGYNKVSDNSITVKGDEYSRKKSSLTAAYWKNERSWPDYNVSMVKNRWVKITGNESGNVCYAQWEDAGPFFYNDTNYVFGTSRPINEAYETPAPDWSNLGAGIDFSPAVMQCLTGNPEKGLTTVSWQFIDASDVPDGAWKRVVTDSQMGGW